eukprot:5058133-Pleurochrysis_carterae.AAC.1
MLEKVGGSPEGLVSLNGHDFTLDIYTQHACVVQQTDQLWWPLSPRDHITYAVNLFQTAMSSKEQSDLIEQLITNTGLASCQNTKAGNIFFKGLSGGQRRRLSLAIALAKRPHVIFLDEPTSGLDAAAAASIMHYLRQIALAEKLAMLCTIHQPSTAVFNGFDKVLFLTGGKPAYLGPASELTTFLERIGKPVAPNANPADFMLDLINKDFGEPEVADSVVAAWATEKKEVIVPAPTPLTAKKPVPLGLQIRVLFRKHSRLLVLDPISYLVRMVMFVGGTCFFAIIYIKTRQLDQPQIVSRVWLTMWICGCPASLAVVLIYLVNTDYQVVKREIKDGMYKPLTYVLAQFVLQLPMLAILSMLALVPAIYPISDWEVSQLWRSYTAYFLSLIAFEFMAELFAIAFANPLVGMLNYVNMWFTAFLFSGILVTESDVPWPVRILIYILPYRWSLGELIWAAFIDTPDYSGTEDCNMPTVPGTPGLATSGPLAGQPVNCPRGFYCPDDLTGVACWGRTGSQIIDGLSGTYSAISDTDVFARDMGLMVLIALMFKLLYLVAFLVKSGRSQAPKKPA